MRFKKPLLLVNFKTYKKGTGKEALKIAKLCDSIKSKMQVAIAVQPADLYRISSKVKIPVFAEAIDVVDYGSNTGSILPEDVKANGAKGTLINHSEHRIPKKNIKEAVIRAKKLKLITIVCAKNDSEGKILSKFKPDYIAIEPPSLIGDPKKSICTEKPSLIKNSVKKIGNNVLVGAGVKHGDDVKIALELGAKGVLLASGVMKAKNPRKELEELSNFN